MGHLTVTVREMIPVMDRMQSWVLQHLRNLSMDKTLKFLGV